MNTRRYSKFLAGFVSSLILISLFINPVPAAFTPFTGQVKAASTAPILQFTSSGHALGFTADGTYAANGSHALHVNFVGSNSVQPQSDSPASTDGKAVPLDRVTYAELWDGITLTYTANLGSIYTTTYTLAPGADPTDIQLGYNAPLTLNEDGTLTIAFETGALTETTPVAWQDIQGKRVKVEVSFRVNRQEVSFALEAHDPAYPLTIDPTLSWNLFLGGSGDDKGTAIAVDGSGNIYVAGYSDSDWGCTPVGCPVRAYSAGYDSYAAKLSSAGIKTWNTFLGGSGDEFADAIAVDGNGNVYVAGFGRSSWGCSPTACTVRAYTAGKDAFAAKLSSSGSLTWNTFLGGSGEDNGAGIAVGTSGNVYVAGDSDSGWGCSPMACTVRSYTGDKDAFAAELSPTGSLTWNTFLGGSAWDAGSAIVVDSSGNVTVAGDSASDWGCSPTACTVQSFNGGYDAFAAKLNSTGGLTWNTFLGGSGEDYGYGIALDVDGNAYIAGYGNSSWGCSPTACTVRSYTGGNDAFAAKLSPTGSLTWNTFLGGSEADNGFAINVEGSGKVYVAGQSRASWGCSPSACTARSYTADSDGFAAELSSTGDLVWNAFLGGSGEDWASGIAGDGNGMVYAAGTSKANWGPSTNSYTAGYDGYAAKINTISAPSNFQKHNPVDGAINQTPNNRTLSWGASSNATTYEYCIDTTDDDSCNSSWISTGTSTSVVISNLSLGSQYWQVRATNVTGISYANGSSSAWWSFITNRKPDYFNKSSPANGATDRPTDPHLSWGASNLAESYEYCIDTTDDNACSGSWISTGTNTGKTLNGLEAGSHYWQVRAKNGVGTSYANGSSTNWWSFSVTPKPGSFGKLNPGDGATNQPSNRTLTWSTSSYVESYEYCIDTTDDDDCTATWISTGTNTSITLSGMSVGIHYWQVRAINVMGTTYANGSSSAWRSFTVNIKPGSFNKSSPANGANDRPSNTRLSWGTSSRANSYEYCIDTTDDDACNDSWISTGTSKSKGLSGVTAGTHYWQVRAKNEMGTTYAGGASDWWSFSMTPIPGSFGKSSPVDGATDQSRNLTLHWGASSHAESYEYCIDTTNDSDCNASWISSGTSTSKALRVLTPGTIYYWQVRAINVMGTTYANGSSSAWRSFTIRPTPGAFEKSSPADGAQPTNPTLSWGASSNATSYESCIDTTDNHFCNTSWISSGTSTSKALSGLTPGGTYYWQVRAKNIMGTTYADGNSNAWWSFTFGPAPGDFEKSSPVDGATDKPTNPTLRWEASSNAISYEYCIDTTDNNDCSTSWISSGTSTSQALSGLNPGAIYYWHVRAVNATGTTYGGGDSAWWSFATSP